ncbi:MAG: DUF5716 family protein [Lachnospiraceae bacterium]
MESLYLGIELDDTGCSMAWFNPESRTVQKLEDQTGKCEIPAYLCLDKNKHCWYAGTEAEESCGKDGCIVLNRLVSLFESGQYLKIDGVCYTDEDMLQEFMNYVLSEAMKRSGRNRIGSLAICLERAGVREADKISRICSRLGVDPLNIHVLNRQEAFMYYLMSQKRETWSNVSLLFDYSREGLFCYEVSQVKGLRPVTAQAHMERIDGAPSMDAVGKEESERSAADCWFAGLAEKKMSGKIVSSVMLSGEGFHDLSWARQFIRSISLQKNRKVYQVDALYGMGAAFAAYHIADEHRNFPYCCICDGRISVTVSIFVGDHGENEQLILARAGTSCHEARISTDLNLIGMNCLNLFVKNAGAQESYKLPLDLSAFMGDGRTRTKIRLSVAFSQVDTMIVRVEDLGFGEFYPSTGQVVEQCYSV